MVKYKLSVEPEISVDGELIPAISEKVLEDRMVQAGWTDDPGQGKAILTEAGSEIVCPIPVAPPIGYVAEPTVMDRLRDMLDARLRQLSESDVLEESEADASDFDVPDPEDFHPRSIYEISLVPEAPALPKVVPAEVASPPPPDGNVAGGSPGV